MAEELLIHKLFNSTAIQSARQVALQIEKNGQWQKFTYAEVQALSFKVTAFLSAKGFGSKDFAAIILENRPEWPVIYFGIVQAALTAVPVDPQLSPEEIKNLIDDCGAKIIFSSSGLFKDKIKGCINGSSVKTVILDLKGEPEKDTFSFSEIENMRLDAINFPSVLPSDTASLIYTSGTTGKPKGVMLSHYNICSNFLSIKSMGICAQTDNFLSILPLYHSYPFMVTLITPLLLGAKVTYVFSFKPEELSRVIKEAGVTLLAGVPQLFSLLHKAIYDKLKPVPFFLRPCIIPFFKFGLKKRLGSLRILVSGGARLEPEAGRGLAKVGLKVIEGYGLTETSPVVTLNLPEKIKFGSVGRPIPGVRILIHNPDKSGRGETLIRGPNVMQGYFKQQELTQDALKEGWLYSGDTGHIDKDGYLFLEGRQEEVMVLASGKNIYPEELEAYYMQSPYIKEMCIFLKRQDVFGYSKDLLFAVIVPDLEYFKTQKEANINEKIHWEIENMARALAPYKHIMGFTLTREDLPRTALKKIKRFVVKEKYSQETPAEEKVIQKEPSKEEQEILNRDIPQKIIRYISKEVNSPVYLNSHLEIDLGIDSLTRVELSLGLEKLFKVRIPDEFLYSVSTVKDVIINMENLIKAQGPQAGEIKEAKMDWGALLRQKPAEAIKGKISLHFGIFRIFPAWIFKFIFLSIFRVFWFLRIEGKANLPGRGPYIICPNHASYLDGLFIFTSIGFKASRDNYFLGYQRIFEHPLLAWANKISRLISIDAALHLAEAMQAVSYVLSAGKIVCIFPEGIRSIDSEVKDFKKGVGILMKELDIPAVPVYIRGSHQSWPRGSRFPRLHPVKVIFGKPVKWQELGNTYEEISNGLREEVLKVKKLDVARF
jgi:long-chain acyl-CoA synthetase